MEDEMDLKRIKEYEADLKGDLISSTRRVNKQ